MNNKCFIAKEGHRGQNHYAITRLCFMIPQIKVVILESIGSSTIHHSRPIL